MGRKRIDEDKKRIFVGIRLPGWLLNLIKKEGTVQEVIERHLISEYEKKRL